jgi:hypothetical protein
MKNDDKKSQGSVSQRYWENMSTVWAGVGESRRRGLRILPKGQGYFVHVTSRIVGQEFLFGELEKRVFVRMMRQWTEFSGLGVITYCLMDNHFHLMLWVPGGISLDHNGVLSRLEGIWPEEKVVAWEECYKKQDSDTRQRMDEAVMERMADLPEFMRILKQSFTRWYNRKNDRTGTLWDSRYRSVVVEDSPLALMSVAAYIDLNPLRAGMVEDPMTYAWSGYGAAMGGNKIARKGLDALVCLARGHQPFAAINVRKKQLNQKKKNWREIAPEMAKEHSQRAAPKTWKDVQAAYRIWLMNKGEDRQGIGEVGNKKSGQVAKRKRKGLDPVRVIAEYEKQGVVPLGTCLQMRTRAFTRGVALGSTGFLEDLMAQYRSCFGPKRKKAARRIRSMGEGVLAMRQV